MVKVATEHISPLTLAPGFALEFFFARYCCDLTFRAFRAVIPNLEHLYIIEVLTHANATIMFKDSRCSL